MNITIIIGWVIAFGMVVFGIFQGGQIDWFIDPPSLPKIRKAPKVQKTDKLPPECADYRVSGGFV